jgi:hypothetical protein
VLKLNKKMYFELAGCAMLASPQHEAECGILTYFETKNAQVPVRLLPDVPVDYIIEKHLTVCTATSS